MADLPYGKRLTCTPPELVQERPQGDVVLPPGFMWTCPDDQTVWIVRVFRNWGGINDLQWVCVRPAGAVDPTIARVAALEDRTVTVHRVLPAATVALAAGKGVDVTVTWPTAFPDANYRVEALVVALLLGKATAVVKPGTQTAAGVVITVTPVILVAIGTPLLDVTATRYA